MNGNNEAKPFDTIEECLEAVSQVANVAALAPIPLHPSAPTNHNDTQQLAHRLAASLRAMAAEEPKEEPTDG